MGWEGMYWIDLAQNRDQGQSLLNMVMTVWLLKMQGVSWPAEDLLASQEELCFMELLS